MANKTSLWGDEYEVPSTQEVAKSITKKIKEPKSIRTEVDKLVASKTVSDKDKMPLIIQEVYRILGVYKDNTVTIKSKEQLIAYTDAIISNGVCALDTETNKSLQPVTCKIMGLCLYTPNQKQAYVPVNHCDIDTGERLGWQVTEEDIHEQIQRMLDNNVQFIFQNAQFDYRVVKCTCNIALTVYWDTLVANKILNEKEEAGLKYLYRTHIDNSIEKYSIEHLFKEVAYENVPPEVFALYAATDSYMTYKIFEYQQEIYSRPEYSKLYELLTTVEFPVIIPTAEMMLNGVYIDEDFSARLSKKYHDMMDATLAGITKEIHSHDAEIAKWRLSEDANRKELKVGKDGKPVLDKNGNKQYMKSKSEQLPYEMNLGSNQQMCILFYDVLGIEKIYKKDSKTGKTTLTVDDDAINQIYNKTGNKLCKLIIDYRHISKMISTYVDKMSEIKINNRIYAGFNQNGTDTGRFSSSDPKIFRVNWGRKIRLIQ